MNIADLDLAATFAAFDQAEADGDVALCEALLAHAQRLTGRPPQAVTAAGAAPALPTSIFASTAVQRPDPPTGDAVTQLGERCGICRLAYEGSAILPVKVGGETIMTCRRCRQRKPNLVPA